MVTKQLKKITQEEFDAALTEHFFYQKGDESKRMVFHDCDFSGIQIIELDLSGADFSGSDFSKAISYGGTGDYGQRLFYRCNLDNVNFSDCNLAGIDFSGAMSMKSTILIGAKFTPNALIKFKSTIIATKKEQELHQFVSKQQEEIQDKDEKLEKTSEKQSEGMLDIFNELKKDFSREERLWLTFGFYIFLILFMIASALINLLSPLISAYANIVLVAVMVLIIWSMTGSSKDDNYNPTVGEYIMTILILFSTFFPVSYFIHEAYASIFGLSNTWTKIIVGDIGMNQIENIAPFTIILFSTLWFSVHQYGRAKKLRIEQQNKQAMIHFMQAILANDGKLSKENQTFPTLAPFFANAIIHRPFSQDNYDPQLPIDEVKKVIDMAKIFQK